MCVCVCLRDLWLLFMLLHIVAVSQIKINGLPSFCFLLKWTVSICQSNSQTAAQLQTLCNDLSTHWLWSEHGRLMRISAHIWREYVNCTQKGRGLPLNPEPDHLIPHDPPVQRPGCIYTVYKKRKRLQLNDYSGLDTQEKPTSSYYLITMQVKDGGRWVGFLVSQVMAVLSAEFKACWTFSRSHPQDFSFGVPLTVNQTIF